MEKGEIFEIFERKAIELVIPKEGKDRNECANYGPISALNEDCKMYALVIARRIESLMFLMARSHFT